MSIVHNPLAVLIEESIHLRDIAQVTLTEALNGQNLTRLERLVLIAATGASRPQTVAQTGRNLGHSRQVVQRATNRLEELGFMQKHPNPDHKRSPLFSPTDAGREFEHNLSSQFDHLVNE